MSHEFVGELLDLWQSRGHLSYGEEINQMQHALQCAHFAEQDGQPDHIIIAALLHDTGHLLHDAGEFIAGEGVDMCHEGIGAAYLAAHLPDSVTKPIRMHVAAKRYLCGVNDDYYQGLSNASKQSLALQGGPFTEAQCVAFMTSPWAQAALTLRKYDDLGKRRDWQTPSFESYQPVILALCEYQEF